MHASLVGLVVAVVRATATGLRWFEVAALTLRGITTECGTCQQRLYRPEFVCGCGRAHARLVPGLQGVFRRTCHCGIRLPTLLITGKHLLPARCGLCRAPLANPVQRAPTAHLPVVGGMGAGKSVFMHTAIARLRDDATFAPADTTTADRITHARDLLRADTLPPTPVTQPVAFTVHLARHLLHLYDAAGEIIERADHRAVSGFLNLAGGVILVVDPFSLPAVATRVDRAALSAARPSRSDPKSVLDGLVETLTETRGSAPMIPVAVVLTKADALVDLPTVPHPLAGVTPEDRSAATRRWLIDQGRIDLVNSVERHFTEARYFAVTYLDADEVHEHPTLTTPIVHDDPASPIRWLLGGGRHRQPRPARSLA
ncbi:TRAFAC clade GTPase domain-containing protein [Actinokineospora sp. NPDC004072]